MSDFEMTADDVKVAEVILKELETEDSVVFPSNLKRKYQLSMSQRFSVWRSKI